MTSVPSATEVSRHRPRGVDVVFPRTRLAVQRAHGSVSGGFGDDREARLMLHVHTGDCAASQLGAAGVAGEQVVWTELLVQGPLRPALGDDAFRAERAAVLSESTGGARSPSQCLARLRRQDESLGRWRDHDETVLWVDACLYDQAILVQLLARLPMSLKPCHGCGWCVPTATRGAGVPWPGAAFAHNWPACCPAASCDGCPAPRPAGLAGPAATGLDVEAMARPTAELLPTQPCGAGWSSTRPWRTAVPSNRRC